MIELSSATLHYASHCPLCNVANSRETLQNLGSLKKIRFTNIVNTASRDRMVKTTAVAVFLSCASRRVSWPNTDYRYTRTSIYRYTRTSILAISDNGKREFFVCYIFVVASSILHFIACHFNVLLRMSTQIYPAQALTSLQMLLWVNPLVYRRQPC